MTATVRLNPPISAISIQSMHRADLEFGTRVKVMDGNGRNNKTLVEFAIEQRKSRQYDDVWCVFDRDSVPKDTINSAIQIAEKNGIRIAASNECFELWYPLHFCFLNDQCTREAYQRRLKKYLAPIGITYEKQSLYNPLLNQQETAIKHAKKLIEHHGISVNLQKKTLLARYPGLDFVNTKPFTTIHDLVTDLIEELNKIGTDSWIAQQQNRFID